MSKQPTVRLNATIREAILSSAIEKTVWAKMKVALEERTALAEEVRQLSFGGKLADIERGYEKVRSAIDDLNKLCGKESAAYVSYSAITGCRVTANVNGMHIELPFAENYSMRNLGLTSKSISWSQDHSDRITEASGYRERITVHDESLKARIVDNQSKIEELEKEAQTIVPTIIAILRKAQTLQKLLELWPEAEKYVPEDLSIKKVEGAGLPISIDDLNNKLSKLAA